MSTGSALRPSPAVDVGRRRAGWPEAVALCGFATALAVAILRHDMWFDELQAWNVARSSRGLGDLVAQLRYEGHPILWYLPLFALSRFTGDPRAMQVLELFIAVASVALILYRSPYARWLRITLCATYFVAFEYTVLARSYGLGLLCFLVALDRLARPEPSWSVGTVALVVLSWTSLLGAVLAGVTAVALYAGSGPSPWLRWSEVDPRRRRLAAWVVTSCALVAVTCVPPSDFASGGPAFRGNATAISGVAGRAIESVSSVWRGLVPIPAVGTWNTNVLDRSTSGVALAAVLAIVLALLVGHGLRRWPFAQRMWVLGVFAYVGFFLVVVRPTETRYTGYLAMVLLGATWFVAARSEGWLAGLGVGTRVVLALVLAAQLVAGVGSLRYAGSSFAPNEALARAAEAHGVASRLVSADDFAATGVAAYLDHDVYSIPQGQWRRTLRFDEHQRAAEADMTAQGVWCEAARLARVQGAPVGLLTSSALDAATPVARVRGWRLFVVGSVSTDYAC